MQLRDKLRKTGRNALIAAPIIFLAVVYFFMTVIKGLYLWTTNSPGFLADKIARVTGGLINGSYKGPGVWLWETIPHAPFNTPDILAFYSVITPPLGVFMACTLFVSDYRNTKAEYHSLLKEAKRERNLRELKEEMGEQTVNGPTSIEVIVNQSNSRKPLWHERAWGKIAIGVMIALIVTAIGLQ